MNIAEPTPADESPAKTVMLTDDSPVVTFDLNALRLVPVTKRRTSMVDAAPQSNQRNSLSRSLSENRLLNCGQG